MANLMELLQGHIDEDVINTLSDEVGADPEQTQSATDGILTALLGGLAKNTQHPGGAAALSNALDKDQHSNILSDILGAVTGGGGSGALNGAGILSHILGGNQGNVISQIASAVGMDSGAIGALMLKLAPLVMGVLGQQKQQAGLNPAGLASLLLGSASTVSQQHAESESPFGSILSSVLGGVLGGGHQQQQQQPQSGGGLDSLLNIGKGLLGGLFK
jgi:hypothetical protein